MVWVYYDLTVKFRYFQVLCSRPITFDIINLTSLLMITFLIFYSLLNQVELNFLSLIELCVYFPLQMQFFHAAKLGVKAYT